jgi:DNA-binding transcriptional LysR family regulator
VLTEGLDADLRRRLAEHRLDAALTLLRDGEQAECVVDEGYAMLLPDSHRLARHSLLTADELAGETMIARRSCEILAETSRFFTARGVRPRFSFRSPNEDRCLALVRAGAGITTGPVSLAGNGVVAVPVEGYDFRRRVGLVLAADQAAPAWFASVSKSVRA